MRAQNKKHTIGLILLSFTALFWGVGFVLNADLKNSSFANAPAALNAVRFVVSTLALLIIFAKKLKLSKKNLLFGGIGGLLLFAGFQLQVVGLGYTTPAHCGFYTAAYVIFVPLVAWISYKKRPSLVVFAGVALAIAGLVILNLGAFDGDNSTVLGDMLTLAGAVMFALQIVWSDYALKKDVDYANLTFWQVAVSGVLFVAYSLIFESPYYDVASFDFGYCSWRLAIVSLGGTAFAYYSQSFAQNHLNPSETSLILSCESPIGAIVSLALGLDKFTWTIIVGGLLVILAVIVVEALPNHIAKRIKKNGTLQESPPQGNEQTNKQ